jgi:proteasome accessory factor C
VVERDGQECWQWVIAMADALKVRGPRSAGERLRRLLVMLPWLMEREEVPVAVMAAQFHVSPEDLVRDLELAALCGLPPYEDELIDLYVDDGPEGLTVYAGVPRLFTRPFRLTAPEGFALLAAGRAAQALPGADSTGPLARALDVLERRLGGPSVAVAAQRPPWAEELAAAVEHGAVLSVRYWAASRDQTTDRQVVPRLLFSDRGDWYVVVDDQRTHEERTFRVDRIETLSDTGSRVAPRAVPHPTGAWFEDDGVETATLRVAPSAAWVTERYPMRQVTQHEDGWLEAVVPVVSEQWLGRLLLRVGTAAVVVEPEKWRNLGAMTAARVVGRYGGTDR